GFASGTANTGGHRGQVRGVVHGQEAVIPLPSGGKVPVELRMPESVSMAGGGASNIAVTTNVYMQQGRTETRVQGGSERDARLLAAAAEQAVVSVLRREQRQGGVLWNPGGR